MHSSYHPIPRGRIRKADFQSHIASLFHLKRSELPGPRRILLVSHVVLSSLGNNSGNLIAPQISLVDKRSCSFVRSIFKLTDRLQKWPYSEAALLQFNKTALA